MHLSLAPRDGEDGTTNAAHSLLDDEGGTQNVGTHFLYRFGYFVLDWNLGYVDINVNLNPNAEAGA